jgi:predicted dienelactone hydrolase
MYRIILLIAVLAMLLVGAATAQDGQPVHSVGLSRLSVPYVSTDSDIQGVIWYPTNQEAVETALGPFTLLVATDAEIIPGRHPLAVISRGSGGSHMGHRDTAMYLAGRGYVVISLLHPRNNYMDDADGRTKANWVNRPRHVSAVLDWLLNQSRYADFIDSDRIGVIGHSAGGYTALALVGGVPDFGAIGRHCSEHRDDIAFCGSGGGFLSWLGRLFSVGGGSRGGVESGQGDARIRAAVLLAPMGVLFEDTASLARVTVPVLIFRAEKDTVLRSPYHAESIREKLPVAPQCVVVSNGGHFSFLAPFPEEQKKLVGPPAQDPEGFDRVLFHEDMNGIIGDFLGKALAPAD